jgi:nucleoside-diphosphate-sugar epimerase
VLTLKNQTLYEEENFWNGAPHESVFEYGFSKKFFVALGNAYFKEYIFSSANIVLSNMYGPHDHFEEKKSHALGALIKKIYDAKLIIIKMLKFGVLVKAYKRMVICKRWCGCFNKKS